MKNIIKKYSIITSNLVEKPNLIETDNKLENGMEDLVVPVSSMGYNKLVDKDLIIMVVYENMYIHWHELNMKDIDNCNGNPIYKIPYYLFREIQERSIWINVYICYL